MVHKVHGIVFRFTKYQETSIIVTIFTDAFGLQSYIVNGVRSKGAKSKIALYQPLTLLQLVVYRRENANIERIKELQCYHPYSTLTTDIRKSSIGLFLAEVLNKTVKEESNAGDLFDFLSSSLITLDLLQGQAENFHLIFLLRLSRYLGFGAVNPAEIVGGRVADPETETIIAQLLTATYTSELQISHAARRAILDLIVSYYQEHIENFGELKSLSVLKEVFS